MPGTSCSKSATSAYRAHIVLTSTAQRLQDHGHVRSARGRDVGTRFAPSLPASPIHSFEGVRHAELGVSVFHHRHHRGGVRLHWHRSRCGGNRQDPVRRLCRPFPGLAGRGPVEKTLSQPTKEPYMQIKLLSIAAAVALAFAGAAQAQTSNDTKARANTRTEAKVDHKAKKADEDRIEADAKAAKAKCGSMKGNEKDICQAEAKANEKTAKAELEQKYEPSDRHARKVEEVKAEGKYEMAKEKCESNKDGVHDCKKQAKAEYDKEKADIKAKHAKSDSKRDRSASTGASRKDANR